MKNSVLAVVCISLLVIGLTTFKESSSRYEILDARVVESIDESLSYYKDSSGLESGLYYSGVQVDSVGKLYPKIVYVNNHLSSDEEEWYANLSDEAHHELDWRIAADGIVNRTKYRLEGQDESGNLYFQAVYR